MTGIAVARARIDASTLSWSGCRCMITTIEASSPPGSGPSTWVQARSDPAEPTSATTLRSVCPFPSVSVGATVEEHITDNARVVLGLGLDPIVPGRALAQSRRTEPPTDPPGEVRVLLQRAQRGRQRGV